MENDAEIDFLYLSEKDMIQAGVLNAKRAVEVMEETMSLLSQGDYIMGGHNHNAHGIMIEFPEKSRIAGFPLNDARDRRFIAMPAYLGGRFHVAGQKWYGSNGRNAAKGLPRSILMATLNNVETGQPLAYMSANLLSAMRTGAMPGLAAKILARKQSKVIAIIGPGVINRACFMAYMEYFKEVDTVQIKGSSLTSKTAKRTADFIRKRYPQIKTITICETLEQAVRGADIISEAASVSNRQYPHFKKEWFKPGAVMISASTFDMDHKEMAELTKVVDNYPMYVNYADEDDDMVDAKGKRMPSGCMGEEFVNMVRDKVIKKESIRSLGDIIRKKQPGRTFEDEVFLVAIEGMPIEDVAWGYECYQNALRKNIGTKLNLWDTPALL